jgi:mono/diheme cytochrome c family protein
MRWIGAAPDARPEGGQSNTALARRSLRWSLVQGAASLALWVAALVVATPLFAQIGGRPTRPQVIPPQGPVRQVIFKNCTSCHGIDDYAFNALDRAGWSAHIDARHKDQKVSLQGPDRELLLDWLVSKFGPTTRPFPRTYVAQEVTTFFSDTEAEELLKRACVSCHEIDRVNAARFSPDRWRVVTVDMRERGAKLADDELERLVEWLGRTKGTNPNQ